MNKQERHNRIIQLITTLDRKQSLATHELAEQLGVSEMTVRRDLQELSQEGLLLRKHGGAKQLRQQQAPARQTHNDVGILLVSRTGKYSDPFFNAVLEATERRLHEMNYNVAYINTHAEVSTASQIDRLLESRAVNGLVLVGPPLAPEPVDYLKSRMRALVSIAGSIGTDIDSIIFDGYNGIQLMIDHLVSRGYRRLGFITGHYEARQQGFLDGIAAHSLPNDPALCVTVQGGVDGWTPLVGQQGAQRLMELSKPPDAILCASDLIAIGAIQWLHEHKFHVPEDIAVTGFDNIPESAFTAPALTTVHVYKQLIGNLAAERIVKRIENEDEIPLLIQTPTKLIVRRSCGSNS